MSNLSGRHAADRSRKVIATKRQSTGRPLGATPKDRSGTTYKPRDPNVSWSGDSGGVLPAWVIEAAAQRDVETILYGRRSSKKLRKPVVCPACGMTRSAKGLCDCNSY